MHNIEDLFDDFHFVGVVCQRYHVVGDERLETGDPEFVPRSAGRDRIAYVLACAEESDGTRAAYPVFSR